MNDSTVWNFPLAPMPDLLKTHGIQALKTLGQNFLYDSNLVRKIALQMGDVSQSTVLEIGSGPGALTRALIEMRPKKLILLEYDTRCLPLLKEIKDAARIDIEIIHGDALKYRPQDLITHGDIHLIGNLPYHISTVLLCQWLQDLTRIASLTLMFQKEVAMRLCAIPRTKSYGRLSVLTQFLTTPRKCFDLPPGAFSPPPKVHSTVVQLIPKPNFLEKKPFIPIMEKVTGIAFAQRRKMLRTTLKPLFSSDILKAHGFNPEARAEELSVEDFEHLCQIYTAPAMRD